MRPYGVKIIDSPDVADIHEMGSKGSVGKFAGRSGDYRPISRGARKAATRRHWARRARAANKAACNEES